jgi:hypothetical protein
MTYLYLDSKVEVWYEELLCGRKYMIEWKEFTKAFLYDLVIERMLLKNSID